jgi:TRAP-type uncharacterized transport system substrate-binding protein
LFCGHAPYGQWGVYRRRYLLILTSRADPPSFELGKRVADVLADRLPSSKAQVSRAPNKERVASLISSHQMDVALMRRDDAAALRQGRPPFAEHGPVKLFTIVGIGEFLLACRGDFAARHAWLVAEAFDKSRDVLPEMLLPRVSTSEPPDSRIPLHPGALSYFTGAPMPGLEPHAHEDHTHEVDVAQ